MRRSFEPLRLFVAGNFIIQCWLPIPIVLSFPTMFSSIPPLVIHIPAAFPLGIQIPAPRIGVTAVFALVVDRPIQSRFRFFDRVLALASFIRLHQWSGHKHHERRRHNRRYRCFSDS
jgi:hypothetical protein